MTIFFKDTIQLWFTLFLFFAEKCTLSINKHTAVCYCFPLNDFTVHWRKNLLILLICVNKLMTSQEAQESGWSARTSKHDCWQGRHQGVIESLKSLTLHFSDSNWSETRMFDFDLMLDSEEKLVLRQTSLTYSWAQIKDAQRRHVDLFKCF